jgi:hypothetical protein
MALHYDFPVIHNISDVLPHIDTKNFRVVEKDELTFINYAKMGTDPFPDILPGNTAEANLSAAVRRECRGIAFYTDGGEIASRPFQKFFNAGERAEPASAVFRRALGDQDGYHGRRDARGSVHR